jgi:hypothetical protein
LPGFKQSDAEKIALLTVDIERATPGLLVFVILFLLRTTADQNSER